MAMCVNDIIVLEAEPLFLLDYLASSKIVQRVFARCVGWYCSRMSSVRLRPYWRLKHLRNAWILSRGRIYDIAGFVVGVVEKDRIINGKTIKPGDVVIGLSSSGVHSNGFSLVRKVFFDKAKMKVSQKQTKYGLNTTLEKNSHKTNQNLCRTYSKSFK